ncbi:MAG: hypothetical protein GF368_05940 [Candidatus Aenigmarchaeota archaeon]|nr:hypothetical protein [Candidatus Aenigmarchaeota archaeon]
MSLSGKVSVIGSYPYNPKEPPEDFIRRCLITQMRAGVDFPAAQGARGDMVSMFLTDPNVKGFERIGENGSRYQLNDEPEITGSVQVEDLETIQRLGNEMGYQMVGQSIPVTGPFTLAQSVDFGNPVFNLDRDDREQVLTWIGEMVANIVGIYDERFGGSIIRIDEPVAQSGGLDMFGHQFIAGIWDNILERVANNTPGIHVCGEIAQVAPIFREMRIPEQREMLFSHDFTGPYGKNMGQLTPEWVRSTGAIIGAGVVDSGSHLVESPLNRGLADYIDYQGELVALQDAAELYGRLVDMYGEENLTLHPGCGFGSIMKVMGLDPKKPIHQYIAMNCVVGPKLRILSNLADGSY